MKRFYVGRRSFLQQLQHIGAKQNTRGNDFRRSCQLCQYRCLVSDVTGESRAPEDMTKSSESLAKVVETSGVMNIDKPGEFRKIDPGAGKIITGVSYFDTLAVCKRLQNKGFGSQQAEALTEVMCEVIGGLMENQNKVTVTKPQQEIMVQQLLAQIASVKKDMVILEKSEFTLIRNDTEKQGIMIKQLESKLKDELKKLEGQVKLDINLEKSRAIEAHALNEKQLQSLNNRIEVEHAQNEKQMKALDNKIDIEVSNLRTQNERNKNDVQKYLIGVGISGLTLYLAYLRLIA